MNWKINNQQIQIVSPIAAIYPAFGDLAMWNATHVLPGNILAEPILFSEYLDKGQSSTNVDTTSYKMYEKARIELTVAKALLEKYPVKDLAMFDLVSGAKMDARFEEMKGAGQEGGGGEWYTDVSLGKGSYEGQFGGGGCFGIGFTGERSAGVTGRRVGMGAWVGIFWGWWFCLLEGGFECVVILLPDGRW
jgi:hypothetical protein